MKKSDKLEKKGAKTASFDEKPAQPEVKFKTQKLEPASFKMDEGASVYRNLLKREQGAKSVSSLINLINSGENYIRQTNRVEVKAFDSSFIDKMEQGLDSVAKIVYNPRTFIKEEVELVQVGLARKISSLSVKHFASNSRYVRNIDEDGEVQPDKVLTIHAETDTAIYENRFIMTLIKKCLGFIQARYWYVLEHGETYDSDLLLVHNTTEIEGVKYEVDSRIKVSVPSLEEGQSSTNQEILARLSNLRELCSSFLRSSFMEAMKGAKDVSSPIHMTNMLVKHPDYHQAYLLWNFLDEYEDLGISFDVQETDQKFDDEYKEEIAAYIANSIYTIHSNRVNRGEIKPNKPKKYTPKVIFTLEDETYADGRFLYDAYPDAKLYKRETPMAPLPEEVRLKDEKLHFKLNNERAAKVNLEAAILEDKDRICYEEANKRVAKLREFNAERKALLDEAIDLGKENKNLQSKLAKSAQNSTILSEKVDKLTNQNAKLIDEKESLKHEIKEKEKELEALKAELESLKAEAK